MRVPVWASDLANRFWERAGAPSGFPRDLEASIVVAHEVTIKRIANLNVAQARDWLASLRIAFDEAIDRPLRGCLAAHGEAGIILIDANDSPDEQRFTLAHEVAHFLRDHWRPRERVAHAIGVPAVEVVDGRRSATVEERFASALEGVPLTVRMHLLPRDSKGQPTSAIADAEDSADRLAFELLAPAGHLAEQGAAKWSDCELLNRLISTYGLPAREANHYAALLRPSEPQVDDWIAALRAQCRVS